MHTLFHVYTLILPPRKVIFERNKCCCSSQASFQNLLQRTDNGPQTPQVTYRALGSRRNQIRLIVLFAFASWPTFTFFHEFMNWIEKYVRVDQQVSKAISQFIIDCQKIYCTQIVNELNFQGGTKFICLKSL